ncbi:non-ribosomal peptide synthetase [Rhodococcoides fascians]|uniref:non-ribosomal peptide synthetase n=1 Tax=Rhodococcoides fascians TaxID=1828 RepID=UPI000ADA1BE9|nr:non-ribosomal peptide synthetase [Rhodococcus fascians]
MSSGSAPLEDGLFPLSAAQMNIYFAQKLAPDVPFTIAQYVEIRGHIDPPTLIRATDIACRDLESPGVRLTEIDGRPYQWFDTNVPYAMIHRDFRGQLDPVAYAHEYMNAQYRAPVDLVRDQLIASDIIQIGDEHYYWFSRAHHIVMDGLGAISVQERTAAIYTALLTGTDAPKTRAVGVREIYDYEAAYPASSRYETDRQYWLGRLDGHSDAPRLARSSSVPSGVSISVGAELEPEIADAMAELARRYNSSDVPVVLAAFSLYLARMTDTEDVMLSLPVSGRATTKLRDSSGMMSNVVPLRIGVEPGVTVEELLRRIQVELTGALRHQRFRVEDMQRAAGTDVGAAAGRGIFGPSVNIMMYNSTIRLGDVVGEYRVLSSGPIDDMMVNVYPGVAGATTRVDFLGNPAVYTADELGYHHARFLDLLRELVGAPDGLSVSELTVPGAEDSAAWGTTEPQLLTSLLQKSAVVRYGGIDHTAADFALSAAGVASGLPVGTETRVAVAIGRSYHSLLAAWAVSVAGGSFVPVDPFEPADRLTQILTDASVEVGITTRELAASLPGSVRWLAIEDLLDAQSFGIATPTTRFDNEAYLVHTSGSTGRPKAVSVTHRGLAQLATAVVERYSVTPESRVLHLASPIFDASIQEILSAFAAGATLVIAPAEVYAGRMLADFIAAENITHLVTSPAVLATLEPEDLAGIDVFDVGGEECPPELRDRFAAASNHMPANALSGRQMLNAYGPTEATVLATLSEPMTVGERVKIGTALPGVRAVVLDAHLRFAPRGGVGELYLGGDGIARGYDGQPGLTASRFVADVGGARLYRTGDVVRWAVDGSALEYLGRSDRQVQLQGRRVELGEIESVAARSPGVTAAVAAVHDQRITLYVAGSTDNLDSHLSAHLPRWMVPAHVTVLDAFPMTASGKIDRRALPAPVVGEDTAYVAPRTETETLVATVFADVLGAGSVGRVGREHSFFDLGGDSLSATRVLSRLGGAVTLPTLFDVPTVAGVAAALDASADHGSSLDLLDTQALFDMPVPKRIPLSYSQQRMWFLNQFDASSPAYNMPVALRITDATAGDGSIVVAALRDVLERHESLRTYFPADEDGPRQVVKPTGQVLGHIPTYAVHPDDLGGRIAALASAGFDVADDVPIRAAVLQSDQDVTVVIVLHHIAIDGWSIDPLVRDFAVAHAARLAGHAPTWSRLPAQYSQYAVWNRAVVDAVAESQLAYWTTVLDTERPLAALPADHPRPPVQSLVTADVPITVDASVHPAIRDLAKASNATTFMVVHAALAATLTRFGDATRTVVGTPSAGRGHEALDDMVGMFVGTVPLTVDVDPSSTFTELLAAVRHNDLDAFAHTELPFERIVDALATDRSLDRHPIFQVMLAFDNAQHQSVDDLPITVVPVPTHTSEFDLGLVLTETADGITGQIEYAADLYEHRTVQHFADTLLTVLSTVADTPDAVVGDIELGDIELGQVEQPAVHAPVGTLLDVWTDGNIALDGAETLTYDELDRRSNRIARLLIAEGVGPESLVALSLERSADYVLALWAVAKAGAAFVPVDPTYPAARRTAILDGIRIGFGGNETGIDWVDEAAALLLSDAPVTDAERTSTLLPAHPAYVIHTSGSTGTPKPVAVTHGTVHALAQQVVPRYRVDAESRVLHGYSVNFDAAMLELILAFGAGATLVIAPTDLVDGDAMAQFLTEHAVTHFLSTPAVLATVPPVDSVTTVAVGGDVLGADVVTQWSPNRLMLNAYGPSEATVVATLTDGLTTDSPVTIGRPLAHISAHVLDTRLRPVPRGGVGELYLAGGLARGYGSRAALTAERFVAGPGGTRLYRSGDRVRIGEGGELDFRGRIDTQVQIRGVRVELGDIEAALRTHPDVTAAVADARDGRIVAWVVGVGEQDAKLWLLDRLPLALMPTAIVPIDRLPLTANGKVDTRALVSPDALAGDAVARTLAEDVILGIFADTLGGAAENVSVDANFFVMGGDSLRAARAATRIGAALGTHVPVRTIFESPTAKLLGASVQKLSTEYAPRPALTHRSDARLFTQPAPAERRIWLQNRYAPDSAAYNIAFELTLPDDLDVEVLRAAITDIVERHLPLRTVYPSTPDGPTTTLLDAVTVVSSLDERHADASTAPVEGFDLTMEPPVRLSLQERSLQERPRQERSLQERPDSTVKVLTVVAHHVAVDGLSLGPLARDVDTALTARGAGSAPEFEALAVDYADYRLWQQDVLASVAAPQLDYWRTALAGLPDYLDLPTGVLDADAAYVPGEFRIDADTLGDLRGLAHRLGATVFVVVHAALAAVLAEASGSSDIAIGTPVSGRSHPALDELVGMFVGTVVLRTDVQPSTTFEEFVIDVRNRDLDAFANSDVPFEWVVDAVAPTRTLDTHPLFQVLLAMGELGAPTLEFGSTSVTPRRIDIESTQFDLEVVVEETVDGLTGRLAYSPTRFGPSVPAALADRLAAVLTLVAHDPSVRLGSAEFAAAHSSAIVSTDGSAEQYTLATVFTEALRRWPDNTAILDGDEELTYRELDEHSNALAQNLVRRGVEPGSLVAVALPRSAESVIALWAVAKSGAGYLPIDTTLPTHRIREILSDAAPITGIAAIDSGLAQPTWLTVGTESDKSFTARTVPMDSTAYVIYTSGSTGSPKGVRVTHRGIADLVESQRELFDVTPDSRVLQFASLAFDASVFELLLAFGSGGTVVVGRPDVYAGRALETLIAQHQVTHVCLTPTVLQITDPHATPSVEVVIMAGEATNAALLQRWSTGRRVYNAYGPTEGTVMSTCTDAAPPAGPVTIGRPTRGFTTAVLDSRLRPVGEGIVGELYLAGDGLAEGYLRKPGWTSSSFVANPFGTGRLYRTGDLVRWVGGSLEYLGRADSQIKIRGHRVELSEIESALLQHPGVEQASAIGRSGSDGSGSDGRGSDGRGSDGSGANGSELNGTGSLAAYIVGPARPRSVREFLARTLPAYMVPSTVTRVDTLPTTLSGKVDAARLPEPAPASDPKLAPTTPLEHAVHQVFSDVLDLPADRFGVGDNFFDLGGHSLSVVQVVDALGDRLGLTVPVTAMLTHPTVAGVAAQLRTGARDHGGAFDVLLPIRTDGPGEPLFCIHPAIGIAWSYLSLLSETDRPLFGLQVPGIAGGEDAPSTIEDFAARYVGEIRAVQPDGPYHLLGWSLGGVIAHAAAVQLQSMGEEVAQLTLVDATLTAPTDSAPFSIADLADQLGVDGESFDEIRDGLVHGRGELAFLTVENLRRMYAPVADAPQWVAAYRPQVFKGDVLYFAARGSRGAEQWDEFVDGPVSVVRVDAEHENMLGEAGAHALGRELGLLLPKEGVA